MFSDYCTVVSWEGVQTTTTTDYRETREKPLYTTIKIIEATIKGKDIFPILFDVPSESAILSGVGTLLRDIIETLLVGETYSCQDSRSTIILPKFLPSVQSCHLKFLMFFYNWDTDVGVCKVTSKPTPPLARTGPTTACGGIPIRRRPIRRRPIRRKAITPVEPTDIEDRFALLLKL